MAKYLVEDTSLTAVANAIRTKGGTTEALSFPDGFVSAVEGIQAGGGSDGGPYELIYETTFSLDETVKTGNVTVATIDTGITGVFNQEFLAVICCTNDTESDETINHFIARWQPFHYSSGYASVNQHGYIYSKNYLQYGFKAGVSLTNGTATTKGESMGLTLTASGGYDGFGTPCSGDYSLKVYRMDREYFGIEYEKGDVNA